MKCDVCNRELNGKEKYCTYCGTKVSNRKSLWYVWIVVGVAILTIISLICYMFFKDKNEEVEVIPKGNKVTFGTITAEIPTGMGYSVEGDMLVLSAVDGSWFIDIGVLDGSYAILKQNKDQLKESLLATTDTAKDAEIKTIDGVEFVTNEFSDDKVNYLGVYTKINDNKIMAMTIVTTSGKFDYKLLEKVTPIVKSAKVEK